MRLYKLTILIIIVSGLMPLAAGRVLAASDIGVAVTPGVISDKGRAGEMFKYELEVRNTSDQFRELYAIIYDVDKNGATLTGDPSRLNRNTSLASWMEISRAVIELKPKEAKKLPLVIDIGNAAEVGTYHVRLSFAAGNNRSTAEAAAAQGKSADTIIDIEVVKHVVERIESKSFKTGNAFNFNGKVDFLFGISNAGNQAVEPSGNLAIYDRLGNQVEELEINKERQKIMPAEDKPFAMAWSSGQRFGKYRARLDVSYGDDGTRRFQDTIYFWLLPAWLVISLSALIGLLLILMIVLFVKIIRESRQGEVRLERSHVIDLKNR